MTPMTPHITPEDIHAEQEAAQARERGTQLIRSHLMGHLRQNPGSDFVSWIATLHPENAETTIDARFFVANNPWWTVYEEAKAGALPVAVPVFDEDVTRPQGAPQSPPNPSHRAGLVDSLVGVSLLIASLATTVSLEIVIALMIVLRSGSHCLMDLMDPSKGLNCDSPASVLCRLVNIFLPLYIASVACYVTFEICRLVLTVVSSLLVEVFAIITFGLIFLLSCFQFEVAAAWHQFLRRLCHHVRWACRSCSKDDEEQESEGNGEDNVILAEATVVSIDEETKV